MDSKERIAAALKVATDTKVFEMGEGILGRVPEVFKELFPGRKAVVVADINTWPACGKEVFALMEAAGIPTEKYIIEKEEFHAEWRYIEMVDKILDGDFAEAKRLENDPDYTEADARKAFREPSDRYPVAVSVGAGVINDLCKLTSHHHGQGYVCVATAASVDGYTSYGAAMVVNGFKKTVPCAAPLAIIADNAVVSSAPFEMTASGYADLAAKVPGGADWLIADALGEHPIDERAWGMVQTHLKEWLSDPQSLKEGKSKPLSDLFQGLAATGFSMQYYHDSRPASGAEHLCSHAWEMYDLKKDGVNPSHGFKVALGTLIITALMTETFKISAADIRRLTENRPGKTNAQREAQIAGFLKGTQFYEDTLKIALSKNLEGDKLAARRQLIYEKWDIMRDRVMKQLIPFNELRARFELLGCPVNPADIGTDIAGCKRAATVAGMIRKRYTCLDMLYELDYLDTMLDTVFSKGYFQL